jgi:hypothetical protein
MFPQQPRKISFWTLAFIGVLIGLGLFSLWYFHVEPVYTLTNPIVEGAWGIGQTWIPQIQTFLSQLSTQTIATVGVVGGTAVVTKLWKSHVDNQKAQLEAQAQQAVNDNINMAKSYTDLETKYNVLQEQVKNTETSDSKDLLDEAQKLVEQTTAENTKLKTQVQTLQDMLMLKDTKTIEKIVVK